MDLYFLLFKLLLFLVSVIPVLIVSLWIRKKRTNNISTRKVTSICIVMQIASYIGLWVFVENVFRGGADPMVGVILIPAVLVINSLVGLMSYPLVYLLALRPKRWKRIFGIVMGIYILIFLALQVKPLIQKYERKNKVGIINKENTNFYGKITDNNGLPLKNAMISARQCSWLKERNLLSDEDGIFNISGSCRGILIIDEIKFSNGEECILVSSGSKSSLKNNSFYITVYKDGFMISFNDSVYRGMRGLINWKDHSILSPVNFVCNIN